MLIRFDHINEITIPNLNGGEGTVSAKMFMDTQNKVMMSRIPPGSSIGLNQHTVSSEINYVLSGVGKAVCDEIEEELLAGNCQYCPKGSSHSIINTGTEELVLFTVVPQQ